MNAGLAPPDDPRAGVRPAVRHDVSALVDLRVRFLGERARLEGQPGVAADVRARCEASFPVWLGQEERVLLVAGAASFGQARGYALGLVSTWPPILAKSRVGEVSEVYVDPASRGQGLGRALLATLTEALLVRGAQVLRAPVPARDTQSLERFASQGYRPWQYVLVRRQDER